MDITVTMPLEQFQELQKELNVTNKLLEERNRVMEAIPPCSQHGHQCVPHALRWVKDQKRLVGKPHE